MWFSITYQITNNSAKDAQNWWLLPCFQFGYFIGPLVEEYLVISSVYALIDYIILIFFSWLQADNTLSHNMVRTWSAWSGNTGFNVQSIISLDSYCEYDGRVWLTCFCMGGKPGYLVSVFFKFKCEKRFPQLPLGEWQGSPIKSIY